MKSKSIQARDARDLAKQLENVLSEDFNPGLAFVFLSREDQLEATMDLMRSAQIEIFGASTSGEFTEEGIQENGISVLLLEIDATYYKVDILDLEISSTIEAARQLGGLGIRSFANPGYIVSGADISTPGESILQGITEVAGPNATIVGGIAGEPVFFKGIVFTNSISYRKGIIGLILDMDKIEMNGVAVSGWKPVGTEKTVTIAENSWVKEIDHLPALDILQKYMGEDIVTNEKVGSDHIAKLNVNYPLQVQRKSGYAVMRPTLLANLQEKSIYCGGIMEEGDIFRFSIPPDFDVIDKVVDSSKTIKKSSMPKADAMLIFSCVGRSISLGPLLETELEGLVETWKTAMAGFLCLGEFGKAAGGDISEFHGTTCSWVVLKEK